MQAVILCGGRGVRSKPYTDHVPKALLPVHGVPLVVHVMDLFAEHGVTDFLLLVGYHADRMNDIVKVVPKGWSVKVQDTGLDVASGDRLVRARSVLDKRFFLAYCDTLADVDLRELLYVHTAGGWLVTLTIVPFPSPYGVVDSKPDGTVRWFREKPVLSEYTINAGFMVMEHATLDKAVSGSLERSMLPELAGQRGVGSYLHTGYWIGVDTAKERLALTRACELEGRRPWQRSTAERRGPH